MEIGMAITLGLPRGKPGAGGPTYTQIVSDTFTRGDFTPLGVADTGQTWVDVVNGFTVMSAQASPNNGSGTNISVLPTPTTNVRIEATLAVMSSGSGGVVGRYVDTTHYVRATFTPTAFNVAEDGIPVIASTAGVFVNGDIMRLDLQGTAVRIYQNGNLLATGVVTRLTGTSHGLACGPVPALRLDNFKVFTIT